MIFPVNLNKFRNQNLMTTTKFWKNGCIIGVKYKNNEIFIQKWYNNLLLDIQYPGGLRSYWGLKKIKEIDWKIHHFVDNLAIFYSEFFIFRPKKHAKVVNSSLYKVWVSKNLNLGTWWWNLLILAVSSKNPCTQKYMLKAVWTPGVREWFQGI